MYEMKTRVKDEHIDFQGIVDGLYYPFYFEECRHQYVKDIFGVDIVHFAEKGLNLVLVEYTLKFKSSLKKDDEIVVTCQVVPVEGSRVKVGFKQQILCHDKIAAEAEFIATCVPAKGGRPFIPEELKKFLPG